MRAWIKGQRYTWGEDEESFFEPLIQRPSSEDYHLSFTNVVEVFVLRALRTVHDVPLQRVREAIRIAEEELGVQRLLANPRLLRTSDRKIFLDRYANFLELSPSRQYAMKSVLDQYLDRVEWDESEFPVWLYPFPRSPENKGERVIAVNPFIAFGRPILRRTGVSTAAIRQRLDAGESAETLIEDYGVTRQEIEEALLYENAA